MFPTIKTTHGNAERTANPRRLIAASLGFALSAILAFGTLTAPASADWVDPHRYPHYDDHHKNWHGGYYRAPPPVVYAGPPRTPYGYYPPPVVYGPAVGINLPGISINIR